MSDARFDHHDPADPGRMVWYAATSLRGAVAESFGRLGLLDRAGGRRVALVRVSGNIRVLDLVGVAARAVGLTQEIAAATDFAACQAWARALYEGYPVIEGIRWRARQSGSICVVLNDRAEMAALDLAVHEDLGAPAVWPRIARAARDCRITIV